MHKIDQDVVVMYTLLTPKKNLKVFEGFDGF